ncbi:gag/pol protein [Cucumis melo var. makuwa]|uniref:Gag/pol protein n=1 Tax=Cucumis melo var. makuwa TaxID=1194695 RepID=A0A5D3BR47_CUCMM|nr:gag/pol protein [Cucumis melo var. makuwa]
MSAVLVKKHESLATAKEIMDSLKGMFEQPEWSLRHKAIKYIYIKRLKEGTFVREHVLDMMMHFNIAKVNGGGIDEANQVSFILESLPKSFIPFQINVSLNKIEFNLTTLLNELQRFQNLTKGKGKEVEANVATTKEKFKRGSSSKSKIGPSKSDRKIEKKGKGKTPKQNKGKKTTEKGKCYQCGENGHWLRNYPKYLAQKKVEKEMSRLEEDTNISLVLLMIIRDSDQWIKAMDLEMESMYSNFVWTQVDQPNDVRPIGYKWIYKGKQDQAGHLTDIKEWLATQFQMKHLGNAQNVLGIQIVRNRKNKTLAMSQTSYIDKMLSRYKMQNFKKDLLSYRYGIHLSKEQCLETPQEVEDMSNILYASVVGSLMYAMLCTRPDICYSNLSLTGYTDSDFQTDKHARKSTSGSVFTLNGGALVWRSIKQSCIADSTMEAEYVAACEEAKESV